MKVKRFYTEGGKYVTVRSVSFGPGTSVKQQEFRGGIPMIEMEDGTKIKPTLTQIDIINTLMKEKFFYSDPYYHYISDNSNDPMKKIPVSPAPIKRLLKLGILKTKVTKISKKELIVINE